MICPAVRWLRVVLPPGWTLLAFALFYLLCESLYLRLEWLGHEADARECLQFRDALIGVMCVAYGVFRVASFHPSFRPDYFNWLAQTPWTSKAPMPVGPVHLVLQDVVVLGIVGVLMHDSQVRLVLLPSTFLIAYLVSMCASFWLSGQRWFGYLMAFGLGLVVRMSGNRIAMLYILALLYPVAYLGLRRSLVRFPWGKIAWWDTFLAHVGKRGGEPTPAGGLGWPFDVLQPKRVFKLGLVDGLLISLLGGWWLYAIAAATEKPPFVYMIYFYASMGCFIGRLMIYCRHHWSPITLWGRLWTLRWIIPGYDQVFIAPICIVVVAVLAPMHFSSVGLPPEIAIPASLSLVLLVAVTMGPSLNRWRLTGSHRIVPGASKKQEFVEI